ncbi:germin-like protein 1-1 [Cryptomeria japonica]|uniref:germin-like protein 1-1 n=1 Tax=Cryptomeria japonica TaxID=3369 RepID=UPI0027DA75C7|nr:germin-like protein 1-1 [Cryptomeria japonica]
MVVINASDPDPLQDFCVADTIQGNVNVNGFVCKDPKAVKASDFLFRGLSNPLSTNNNLGFNITASNVANFPRHDNVFSQKLEKGDVFVIPRGLVHFQQNCKASYASTITTFNSQFPGVEVVASSVFRENPPIPQDVLAKAFKVNKKQIKELISGQGSAPAPAPVGY